MRAVVTQLPGDLVGTRFQVLTLWMDTLVYPYFAFQGSAQDQSSVSEDTCSRNKRTGVLLVLDKWTDEQSIMSNRIPR